MLVFSALAYWLQRASPVASWCAKSTELRVQQRYGSGHGDAHTGARVHSGRGGRPEDALPAVHENADAQSRGRVDWRSWPARPQVQEEAHRVEHVGGGARGAHHHYHLGRCARRARRCAVHYLYIRLIRVCTRVLKSRYTHTYEEYYGTVKPIGK